MTFRCMFIKIKYFLILKVICDEYDSCGYGFVLFKTEEEARNAILRSKGMLLNGMRV